MNVSYANYEELAPAAQLQLEIYAEILQEIKVIKELVAIFMKYTPQEKGLVDRRYSTHLWNGRKVGIERIKNTSPAYLEAKALFTSLHKVWIFPLIVHQQNFTRHHEKLRRLVVRDEYITAALIKPSKLPLIKWKASHVRDTEGALGKINLIKAFLGDCIDVCNSTELFDQVHGIAFKNDLNDSKANLDRQCSSFNNQYSKVIELFKNTFYADRKSKGEAKAQNNRYINPSINGKQVSI